MVIRSGHVDGPAELLPLRLVVDLVDPDVELLTPGHGDSGIQVVQLGGSEGNGLVLLLVHGLSLELVEHLHGSLQLFLLLLHLGLSGRAAVLVSLLGVLKLLLGFGDGLLLGFDLGFQVLHGLVVSLGNRTLMVTENGDCAIRTVVRQHL